jgi:hypothetical protein
MRRGIDVNHSRLGAGVFGGHGKVEPNRESEFNTE